MEILPGRGFDQVIFGMTREEVRRLIGSPDQISDDDYGGGISVVAWHFSNLGTSLWFKSDVAWRLETIETSSKSARLRSKDVVGTSTADLETWLTKEGVSWLRDDEHYWIESWNMNLWIDRDHVCDVQWAVFIGEDDIERWPD